MSWGFASTGVSTALSLNIAAGTQTATSGTVVFSNSNNITFGMSNNSVITASFSQAVAPGAISAGTTLASSGTVVLSNSNAMSFGMNGQTITASNGAGRSFLPWNDQQSGNTIILNSGNVSQRPIFFPLGMPAGSVACNTVRIYLSRTGGTSLNATVGVAFYTMSNSTRLNLLSSTSFGYSITTSGDWSGMRALDLTGLSQLTLTEAQYVAALNFSASNGSSARMGWAIEAYNQSNSTFVIAGSLFPGTNSSSATNQSQQAVPFWGVYSATTAAFPASPGKSDISYDQNVAMRPYMLITEI